MILQEKTYIYLTLGGNVHWIKKLPEMPDWSRILPMDFSIKKEAFKNAIYEAKANSIPLEDQSVEHTEALLNLKPYLWKRDHIYPVNLNGTIQEVEVPLGEHVRGFKIVARIIPNKKTTEDTLIDLLVNVMMEDHLPEIDDESHDGHCLTKHEQEIEKLIDGIRDRPLTIDAIVWVKKNYFIKRIS